MENQEELNKGIGTKESEKLKPCKLKIEKVELKEIQKVGKKLVCFVKHPDANELIEISSAKYNLNDKLKVTGLWYKLDEDELIVKNSALANLLRFLGVNTPKELEGKEIETIEDEKGYLCFKIY